ncbi:hypothetical protein BD779DRAFT_1670842 [Infundibulicybe gibba]|nr:hypothetical protein BD779DRAFT_1670842 [Infundibulicybe gibba]
MPSTALQSRISAFESLSSSPSPATAPTRISKSPPIAASLLETPLSPQTAASLQAVTSFTQRPSRSPSPSPPNLGRKTSLIDLKDWIVDDGPPSNGFPNAVTPTQNIFSNNPLINLDSPPKHKPKPKPKPKSLAVAPPLPPRKPSYTSLKSVSSGSSPPGGSTTFYPPRRSDSLTVEHTYPPLKVDLDARTRTNGHAPASSISSFHSVSLSSDTDPSTPGSMANYIATFPVDHNRTGTSTGTGSEHGSTSLDESFEDVSFSSIISPSTERAMNQDWERASARGAPTKPKPPVSAPPNLPKRPSPSAPGSPRIQSSASFTSLTATASSSVSTIKPPLPTTYAVRRAAPPPPPTSRSSDRSSILSTATSTSTSTRSAIAARLKRPTPVPLAARRRYEALFNANVIQVRRADKQRQIQEEGRRPAEVRRSRQAAGWRGLSVDLITNAGLSKGDATPDGESKKEAMDVHVEVTDSDRLRAEAVQVIWTMSGLEKDRLRIIWSECDTNNDGSLDRDGFVRGMWRIDEELRRAQVRSSSGSSLFSSGSVRMHRTSSTGSASALKPPRARTILR